MNLLWVMAALTPTRHWESLLAEKMLLQRVSRGIQMTGVNSFGLTVSKTVASALPGI